MTEFVPTTLENDTLQAIILCSDTMTEPSFVQTLIISIGIILAAAGVYGIALAIHRAMNQRMWVIELSLGIFLVILGIGIAYSGYMTYMEGCELAETAFNTYMNDYTEYYKWEAYPEDYIRQLAEKIVR